MGKFSGKSNINKFSTQNRDIKACIAGRFSRTIEEKIEKKKSFNGKMIAIIGFPFYRI